jgi:hypothetical protein
VQHPVSRLHTRVCCGAHSSTPASFSEWLAAAVLQGAWFLAITHIMFEPDPFWGGGPSSNGRLSWKGDDTPLMVLPLLLAWIVLGEYQWGWAYAACGPT